MAQIYCHREQKTLQPSEQYCYIVNHTGELPIDLLNQGDKLPSCVVILTDNSRLANEPERQTIYN